MIGTIFGFLLLGAVASNDVVSLGIVLLLLAVERSPRVGWTLEVVLPLLLAAPAVLRTLWRDRRAEVRLHLEGVRLGSPLGLLETGLGLTVGLLPNLLLFGLTHPRLGQKLEAGMRMVSVVLGGVGFLLGFLFLGVALTPDMGVGSRVMGLVVLGALGWLFVVHPTIEDRLAARTRAAGDWVSHHLLARAIRREVGITALDFMDALLPAEERFFDTLAHGALALAGVLWLGFALCLGVGFLLAVGSVVRFLGA